MLPEAELTLPDPRQKKHYYLQVTPLRRVATPLLKAIFTLLADWQATGAGYLPANGPVVLAANHLTNFDTFPMQFAVSRPIFFMGKAELFQNPLMDFLLRQLGSFPVVRGGHDEWALDHARRVLERGQVLGIFPEGKRSHGQGLHTAKTGAARLALAVNCPIVPMALTGANDLFRRFPRRAGITITLGPPIYPDPDEGALALTDRLMFTLAEMLPPELRGVYSHRPVGF